MTGWLRFEVEATVGDYLDMLQAELNGTPYSKSAHRRMLRELLKNRSDPAIERKHQNISAILLQLGLPCIDGYKPLYNYQRLLYEIVTERVCSTHTLLETIKNQTQQFITAPSVDNILGILEPNPKPSGVSRNRICEIPPHYGPSLSVNYLEREAHNTTLGRAGERLVIQYEKARLIHEGKSHLADRIEHVALTLGDREGFDIRSFDNAGKDRLIEVKTTSHGKFTPFFVSRNELNVSRERSDSYHLYRLFKFRSSPRLFICDGALDCACRSLEPTMFVASVA